MGRLNKLADLAARKYGSSPSKPVTVEQTRDLLTSYVPGLKQEMSGEVFAKAAAKFLQRLPERNRVSIEESIRELHGVRNLKRFRAKALLIIMLAYQNGSADATESGQSFDLIGLIESVSEEVREKYELKP